VAFIFIFINKLYHIEYIGFSVVNLKATTSNGSKNKKVVAGEEGY
jgi:hypothetical protein